MQGRIRGATNDRRGVAQWSSRRLARRMVAARGGRRHQGTQGCPTSRCVNCTTASGVYLHQTLVTNDHRNHRPHFEYRTASKTSMCLLGFTFQVRCIIDRFSLNTKYKNSLVSKCHWKNRRLELFTQYNFNVINRQHDIH